MRNGGAGGLVRWRRIGATALMAVILAGAAHAQSAPDMPTPAPVPANDGATGITIPQAMPTTPTTDAPVLAIAPVLTVDQDRLFNDSAWGRRVQTQLDLEGTRISQENTRLAQQLSTEEQTLTDQRATLDQAEFRRLAEAFDTRATEVRRERAQAVQDLNARADADRTAFYQAALPIMGDLMQQRGAIAVLDRRTVFVSLDSIDITSDLIRSVDQALGDGASQSQMQQGTADAPTPAP